MGSQPSLQQLVAGILRVDAGDIQTSTSLEPLASSLNRAKLAFALQRLDKTLPDGWLPGTFGELSDFASNGTAAPTPAPAHAPPVFSASAAPPGTAVGVDLEQVAALPETHDYWEHDFYRRVFTRAEIAYCLMSEMPRTHLAGFWCAKEALRKCGGDLPSLDLNAIQVSHSPEGSPFLEILQNGEFQRFPAALSISHTPDLAMAAVVFQAPLQSVPAPAAPPPPPVIVETNPKPARISSALLLTLAVTALIALLAFIRTF